ncbi:globin domain-containing protein [Streptomyces sp. NPDC052396]|uniref:globin domain-containing protein n=1 Tax=Streptomyces sp. NPDC052396 TaxID=3365689 RepID=UPI0037D52843
MNTVRPEYHALLARHDAMRLRRRLLSTAPDPAGGRPPYDGAADQAVIHRYLDTVTPFEELIARLYAALFEQWPALRTLFPQSMAFQRQHLADIFRYLTEQLHQPEEIERTFARLGRDHRKLGVRPAHFAAFETALCQALRATAGARWTETMERAWLRMLRFAVAAMVAGAEAAVGEPTAWQATVTGHEPAGPGRARLRVRPHEPYPYRAGQYAGLESPLLPQAWRPYAVAGAPRPDGELEFHIRRAGPGGVSEALVDHTRPGDILRLGPPGGGPTLQDVPPARPVLLVAGGWGWASAQALLEELAVRRRPVPVFPGTGRPLDPDAAALGRRSPWARLVPPRETAAAARRGDFSRHLALVSGPSERVEETVAELLAAGLPAGNLRRG